MSGWFQQQIVHTGRLPLFCFFVAFLAGFGCIRLSVRLIRAQVRVRNVADYQRLLPESPGAVTTLLLAVAALFVLASVTLLKGKIWTGLFGLFVPPLIVVGAIRLARPGSPWARWRYRERPGKLARADRRERRLRRPVINAKIRIQDLLAGDHTQPAIALDGQPPPVPGAAPRDQRGP